MLETKEKYDKNSTEPSEETVSASAENATANTAHEDEIDLADLFRQIWARRRIVLITTVITFLIGIFVAIFSPEEYEASIVLMPQTTSSSSGAASGLLRQFGGIAGINVGDATAGGSLSPSLYPEITQSTPFYLQMMEQDMYFSTMDTTVNLMTYFGTMQKNTLLDYVKTYTIGLPKMILNIPVQLINAINPAPKPKLPESVKDTAQIQVAIPADSAFQETNLNKQDPIMLTGGQLSVMGKLKGRIQTSIEENGTVKVGVTMPDPLVAAKTTEMAVKYLTSYIQEYRTEKAQQNLVFIENQYNEKKEKYNKAQQRLARFQDQNTNIFTESARIELERLKTENNLAFSLYQNLAQQLEQAKIRLQEDMPVFKVLEPIQIPLSISKPNRELIITLSLFAGTFFGLTLVFLKIIYLNLKHKLS